MPAVTPTPAPPQHGQSSVDLPASSPLQACPHCEALIDATEREPLETVSCPGCGGPLQVNGEIAGLQLVEVAGRGGMGVVYKAYDPGLDRHIAIKLLRKNHSSDRRLIDQLENEATITASVNDPNVVRVYSTGFDRGRFFLAMELVDKGSLDDLIHLQGRVAEAQALEVGIQIASGLRAAFQHGLIHRDVKPGNILFSDNRTAKIVDFGLAMFANQMEEESNGEIWGTPYYVPPEKLDGGIEDLRSDIYSLGASLFHAFAGRPPFEAQNASLVALKHLKSQVVSLQAFAPWVSNPTAHIINRTLAKNPADRFQSYDDLIHNLQYALDQLQQGGGNTTSRARVVLETDDDRKTWTWVVLGMAAVIVVLIGVFAFARPKQQQESVAATATKAPVKSTAAPAEEYALKNEVNALAGREDKATGLLEATAGRTSAAADTRAWAQLLAGAAHLSAGRNDAARAAFQKVDALAANVKDAGVAAFLKNVSARLAKPGPIPLAESQNFHRDNHEAVGHLLHGLHNWQNGALEDGAASLRQFRSSTIAGSTAWLSDLKPLATNFVERFVSYQMALDALKSADDVGERNQAAKALRKLDPIFATRANAAIEPYAKEIAEFDKTASKLPEPAIYRIHNKNSKLVLDVEGRKRDQGAKVHQWNSGGGMNQLWELVRVSDSTFKIRAVHSGLVLNVPNSSTQPGTGIWQWKDDGSSACLWKLEPQSDGWFFIRSVASNQVLAIDNMSMDKGGNVTQWDQAGTADHYWRFERVGVRLRDWCVMDLGGVKGPGGSTKIDGSTFNLTANNFDVWSTKDSCRFVYREAVGDFDFVAQLTQMNEIADWSKAGIMVRNTTFTSSKNIFFGFSGRRGIFHQHRASDNADSKREYPTREDLKGPGWIKLSRRGSTFTTYHSTDGQTWTEIGKENMDLTKESVVGLAASANSAGDIFSARFENVSLKEVH